ncbi:TM2 domain-containing protein [Stenotrophomonas indicatrix]|uniref:TM2 domain-containing protein n=1 Tax=Stenotrophomonas indicatrix TaxID=2045451 RepID=UPI0028EF7637|nr:TM2 domain-containing protein [Stenotrophomonas indicatrix]MDT9580988.1 TM2 domain-containing protein [Stenotrophomonas indicatrix]
MQLAPSATQQPIDAVYAAPVSQYAPIARNRAIYILLALFLGIFGVHNFYAGYHGRAICQLLITLLLGWLLIGVLFTGLWALVEMITVETDASGVQMV